MSLTEDDVGGGGERQELFFLAGGKESLRNPSVQSFRKLSSIVSQHRELPAQQFRSTAQPRGAWGGGHQGMSPEMLMTASLTRVPTGNSPVHLGCA